MNIMKILKRLFRESIYSKCMEFYPWTETFLKVKFQLQKNLTKSALINNLEYVLKLQLLETEFHSRNVKKCL